MGDFSLCLFMFFLYFLWDSFHLGLGSPRKGAEFAPESPRFVLLCVC